MSSGRGNAWRKTPNIDTPEGVQNFIRQRVNEDEAGCWRWSGSLNQSGYGRVNVKNPVGVLAHRVSYTAWNGAIPEGLHLDHLCRVRDCVNPAHLEAVTKKVNDLRGFSGPAVNSRKTHCSKGHEFKPENVYIQRKPNGDFLRRQCRACVRARVSAIHQRNKAARAGVAR